jgi:hypothetical protein
VTDVPLAQGHLRYGLTDQAVVCWSNRFIGVIRGLEESSRRSAIILVRRNLAL